MAASKVEILSYRLSFVNFTPDSRKVEVKRIRCREISKLISNALRVQESFIFSHLS